MTTETLTDADIKKRAASYKWDNYVFTISGKARRWALVFQRGTFEDIQFCTLDDQTTPENEAKRLEDNWLRNKFDGEPDIEFLRAVEIPGLGGQHILLRIPASSKGELFRCVRCGCVREGYANFGKGGFWSPYSLHSPQITAEKRRSRQAELEFQAWREFHAPCEGDPQ